MIETIRDSAFGKLLRLLSGGSLLQYPEEMDDSAWYTYLQTSETGQPEESTESNDEGLLQTYGLYAVMSQASSRSRRGPRGKIPEIISWGGPNDGEVRHRSPICVSFLGLYGEDSG